MVFSLSGCGEIKKAENSVNGMFAALKEADVEKVSEYMNLDDFKTNISVLTNLSEAHILRS